MGTVLVACEQSGVVRDAFLAAGHDAYSCDIQPGNSPRHIQWDVRLLLECRWDLVIAHPPCTHLAASGARWFAEKRADGRQQAAIEFARACMNANAPRIAVENPVSVLATAIRPADQIIQPYMFGHTATKTTCLWLTGLPHLLPTAMVGKGARRVYKSGKSLPAWYDLPPGPDRAKIRSVTFQGIADAMATQWGVLLD